LTSKIFACFIGMDGSGKSTITTNVFHHIRKENVKVRKTYGQHQPLVTRFVMALGRFLFLSRNDMFSDYEKYLNNKKSILKKAPRLASMYISLIIIEYYFEMIFKIIIPYKLGYSIVCDRYVYDTIINEIAIDMNLSIEETYDLLQKFWHFIPRPDITFLMQVPEEIAFKRKNDIPSLGYLRIRKELYMKLATKEKILVLDGTLIPSELEKMVYAAIDNIKKSNN